MLFWLQQLWQFTTWKHFDAFGIALNKIVQMSVNQIPTEVKIRETQGQSKSPVNTDAGVVLALPCK